MTQVPAEEFELPHFNFFLGMIIMGGLGAFVVAISNERNTYKAFPLGGGAPSLLNTAGTVAAVGGGSTAVMTISPNVHAQSEAVKDTTAKDSITVNVSCKVDQFVSMVIGMENYPLKDSTQIKILKVTSVHIGDLESYEKHKVPQKDSIHIRIIPVIRKKSKGKRYLMKAIFTMQQQVQRKKEPKKFKVVIE